MYRHSPVRNPRSKGIKIKNVLQVCLLLAVCFWLIFQVKRSHDKKKEFDSTKIASSTNTLGNNDEVVKLGRKDIQPKLEKEIEIHEEHEEQDEEQDEEKIEEEKDDGGGGGDDEIDENEQEKSDAEVDHEEMGVIDEESGEKDAETQTENVVSADDHEEDGATVHTHEGREEHYKADDASSAVVTHLATENGTLDNNSSEEISSSETVNNGTPMIDSNENGPPSSTTIITSESTETLNVTGEQFAPNQTEGSSNSSYVSEVLKSNELNSSDSSRTDVKSDEGEGEGEGESEGENLESNDVIEGTEEILDPDEGENETHLEEKEVRMDLDTLPEIETEGGNSEDSEDTAVERR